MILPINSSNHNTSFSAETAEEKKLKYNHDTLLSNNPLTNARIGMDKFTNAITLYPAKGLTGNKNANFYEFLTMGTVPYLIGSLTLMSVFNAANKYYPEFDKMQASKLGRKMALGVLFYGLAKNISKSFVTVPVHALTGVDTQLPYAKVNYELPDDINDTDITSIEYHKVFESVEFPRWDLLYKSDKKGQVRNAYFDRIGRRLGLGKNLKDSDQEVKPRIKEIVVKTNVAANISSYLWAAAGVGLAFQAPWEKFFKAATFKFWQTQKFKKSLETFWPSLKESAKEFYHGDKSGNGKYAGKVLLFTAAASSIIGVINAFSSSNKPAKLDSASIIEKDRKYVVN